MIGVTELHEIFSADMYPDILLHNSLLMTPSIKGALQPF